MAKASRTISHIEEQMSENAILDMWTQTWGIKVYPAYGIDKIKFSFIEKGAQGKGKSFDIYMECLRDGMQCFDNWAYDILHARFERTLANEKQAGEKYPKAYKYTTGENAEKSLGIMNSTTGGYCINASVPGSDGKKVFCNIPVSFHDLRHIAERYQLSYASRKEELEKIREKAALNWKTREETDDTSNGSISDNVSPEEQEKPTVNTTQKETPVKAASSNTKSVNKQPTPDTTEIRVKTNTTLIEDDKGNFFLSAIDKQNKTAEFIFPKQYWDSNKYGDVGESFKTKALTENGFMTTLHFYVYKNRNYVAKIEK